MKKTNDKNFLLCNKLILNGMLKRRKLAYSAISKLTDNKRILKLVK